MIGAEVGNFRIVKQLGEGGMGAVFLGEQKSIRTKVAIKTLLPHISSDRDQVERFFNEAIAVSRIKHSGIVKIFDVGFLSSGQAYLVMELLEGETLASRIERVRRLAIGQIADVGRQIASVLDATHRAGITHRDLKPDNVFLVPDAELESGERVKILDFGIAKLGGAGLTNTSMGAMGTPAYMAPEQWRNAKSVDWRADAYSLGCLAFEMAAGRPPFLAESLAEACTMHLTATAPSICELVPELPKDLDTLLTSLLAKSPQDRPSTMKEIGLRFASLGKRQAGELPPTILAAGSIRQTPAQPLAATIRLPARESAWEPTPGGASAAIEQGGGQTASSRRVLVAALVALGAAFAGLIITVTVIMSGRGRDHHSAAKAQVVEASADHVPSDAATAGSVSEIPWDGASGSPIVAVDDAGKAVATSQLLHDAADALPRGGPCDAAALTQKGQAAAAVGQYAAALEDFERALACAPSDRTREEAFVAACNAKNTDAARGYFRTLGADQQARLASMCVRNGITLDTLRGTSAASVSVDRTVPHPTSSTATSSAAPAAQPGGDCDEVSCVLNNYAGACCAKFKRGGARGHVHVDTNLPEELDAGMVASGLSSVGGRVSACADRSPAKGVVKAHIKVGGSGNVENVSILASPDDSLAACVQAALAHASFPQTQRGGSFAYPFIF